MRRFPRTAEPEPAAAAALDIAERRDESTTLRIAALHTYRPSGRRRTRQFVHSVGRPEAATWVGLPRTIQIVAMRSCGAGPADERYVTDPLARRGWTSRESDHPWDKKVLRIRD
jgi:hypothetical protein